MMKRFNKSGAASIAGTDGTAASASSPNSFKREQSSDSGPDPEARISSSHDRSNDVKTPALKKRKTKSKAAPSKLSFGLDDEDEDDPSSANEKPKLNKSQAEVPAADTLAPDSETDRPKSRLGANKLAGFAPKAITKHALRQEAEQREALREEFRKKQERVKEANIVIPFVFFEGTNTVTSRVKLKKGDTVDVLLSGAQKILVKENYKKWVHLKLDDLMLVRGGVMIPHVSSDL